MVRVSLSISSNSLMSFTRSFNGLEIPYKVIGSQIENNRPVPGKLKDLADL